MSEETRGGAPSIDDNRHLVVYGVGGDYIGARRARRAFRFLVLAIVGFTFSLYFVEHYLRYDLNEVQYRMALTLEDDSQRAILRNVVRRDAEEREVPTAKYVEALANIEEDDLVLDRFAEAVKLAPDKGSLLIVYGCKLLQQGFHKEARQVLREATLKTTRNALPKYLQAAALAGPSASEEDFRTAVALLSRANDSGEQVLFPQPLWHESLPKRGNWYEMLQRKLADQCCAPLYGLKNAILNRAQEAMKSGDLLGWDGWLFHLEQMGERLVGAPTSNPENLGTSQAIYGLQIQKDAIQMRLTMAEHEGKAAPAGLVERLATIADAMGRLQRFEMEREKAVAAAGRQVRQPLVLSFYGFLLLAFASVVFWILSRAFRTDKNARALRQTRTSVIFVSVWAVAVGATLIVLFALHGGSTLPLRVVLGGWWYVLLLSMVLFSLVYPAVVLPSPETVCHTLRSEPYYSDKLAAARRSRRKAYLSMSGRLLDIALGTYSIAVSVTFVAHRIVTGLYPTDVKLLIGGMEPAEIALIHEIQQLLTRS